MYAARLLELGIPWSCTSPRALENVGSQGERQSGVLSFIPPLSLSRHSRPSCDALFTCENGWEQRRPTFSATVRLLDALRCSADVGDIVSLLLCTPLPLPCARISKHSTYSSCASNPLDRALQRDGTLLKNADSRLTASMNDAQRIGFHHPLILRFLFLLFTEVFSSGSPSPRYGCSEIPLIHWLGRVSAQPLNS